MDIDLLSRILKELVTDHDMVGLPGIGTFVTEVVPASFSDKGYTINPPYRRLSFVQGRVEDKLLIDFYSESNEVDVEVAEAYITQFLHEMKQVLKERKIILLPGLGRLRATKENNFFFVPEEDLDIYPDGFALKPVSLKNIQREMEPVHIPVSFAEAVQSLMEKKKAEPQPEAEQESQPQAEPQPEAEPEPESQPQAEVQPEPQLEQPELEADPEQVPEAQAEPEPKLRRELVPLDPEQVPYSGADIPLDPREINEAQFEPESEPEPQPEPEAQPQTDQPEAEREPELQLEQPEAEREPEQEAQPQPEQQTELEPEQEAQPQPETEAQPQPEQPQSERELEQEPEPQPESEPEQEAQPRQRQRRRWWVVLLVVVALLAVALGVFVILAHAAPDFIDSILYTPEELRIINA